MKKKCDNCERIIGNLQMSFLYKNHTVCKACKILLENDSQAIKGKEVITGLLPLPELNPAQKHQMPRKHSRMGIASFIIALGQGFVTMIFIILAIILASTEHQNDNTTVFLFFGMFLMVGILSHLVGVGLGIAGTIQKSRRKIFAIIGLVLNVLGFFVIAIPSFSD
ncbi:MAG: hypothetical protein JW715_10040 [Sedimentisphaerales bacterium]|nr:hypothetical protein [Sedimentisphaerales bacterium]